MPLLDLMVSQGYPCIKYEKDLNAIKTKSTAEKTIFFADTYAQGCPAVTCGDKIFDNANSTFQKV